MPPIRTTQLAPGSVALLGLPWDENSTYARGAALAPDEIRAAFACESSNTCAENGVDLSSDPRFTDLGNVSIKSGDGERTADTITSFLSGIVTRDSRPLSLGGDHAVTYPILRAFADHRDLTILHIDAHSDLYDSFDGNRLSHASPFARIMEEELATRLVQVGIRTMTPHQREQANRFGVEVHEMRQWHSDVDLRLEGNVYVSIDLDGLDPAFAPGVSHQEPGGLSTREVLRMIHGIRGRILGADVVEYNPSRDVGTMTAMLAAKLVKELAATMLASGPVAS